MIDALVSSIHSFLIPATNIAIASILICIAITVAARCVRKRSLPLQYSILISATYLLLACPPLVYVARKMDWGIVNVELAAEPNQAGVATSGKQSNDDGSVTSRRPKWIQPRVSIASNPVEKSQPSEPNPTDTPNQFDSPTGNEPIPETPAIVAGSVPVSSENGSVTSSIPTETTEPADKTPTSAMPALPEATSTNLQHIAQANVFTVITACVLGIWFAGMIYFANRLGRGLVLIHKLRRSMNCAPDGRMRPLLDSAISDVRCSQPIAICSSALAPAPMTIGIRNPAIVLPVSLADQLNDEELRTVLIHEVAHVVRNDNRAALLQSFASVIFWWNPILHLLNRSANRIREQICDDYVQNSPQRARSFAEALLKVAEFCVFGQRIPAVTTLVDDSGGLPDRLQRLTSGRKSELRLSKSALRICLISVLPCLAFALIPAIGSSSQPEDQRRDRVATSVLPQDFDAPNENPLKYDETFRESVIQLILKTLRERQPKFMTVELTRRIDRRFRLIIEDRHVALRRMDPEWRQRLLDSIEFQMLNHLPSLLNRRNDSPKPEFFDDLKTLEWKLWLAVNRQTPGSRLPKQKEWLRGHIQSLPELPGPNGGFYCRHSDVFAMLKSTENDLLEPTGKTALSDTQFAEFQQALKTYKGAKELQFVESHIVKQESKIRYQAKAVSDVLFPTLQLPFPDDVRGMTHHSNNVGLTFGSTFYPHQSKVNHYRIPSSLIDPNTQAASVANLIAQRTSLMKRVVESSARHDENLRKSKPNGGVDQRWMMQQLELDLFDLKLVNAGIHFPGVRPRSIDEIARLRAAVRIRWGKSVDGLQVGFGRTSDQDSFTVGDEIPFQMYVRNSTAGELTRTVRARDLSNAQGAVSWDHRIGMTYAQDAKRLTMNLKLKPGEVQSAQNGRWLLNTTGLRPGTYSAWSYMPVSWEDAVSKKYTDARPPLTAEVSGLEFKLLPNPAEQNVKTKAASFNLDDSPEISWGAEVQGLQAGARYQRGFKHKEFNNPANWNWTAGETVTVEVFVRNVSDVMQTFSFHPTEKHNLMVSTEDCDLTPYDAYGAVHGTTERQHKTDYSRTVSRVLQAGESVQVALQKFVLFQHPGREEYIRILKSRSAGNQMAVDIGSKYWYRSSDIVVTDDGEVDRILNTGRLRLWTGDHKANDPLPIEKADTDSQSTGTVSLKYDMFGAAPECQLVITSLDDKATTVHRTVKNGGAPQTLELPVGRYKIARRVSIGPVWGSIDCNVQKFQVKPDQTAQAYLVREGQLVVAKHQFAEFKKLGLQQGALTVFKIDNDEYDVNTPARYFDFQAKRNPIAVATIAADGRFETEPLPVGRYAIVFTAFQTQTPEPTSRIKLPWRVCMATFKIRKNLVKGYFYPSEFQLIPYWNNPALRPLGTQADLLN